jgi:integrase
MGRTNLPLGTYGAIRVYPTATGFRVRTLYRDFDGQTRPVERKGRTKSATTRALIEALRDRARTVARGIITGDTRFRDVAILWFASLEEDGRSPSTIQLYGDRLQKQILPALGNVKLRELTVGLIDRHLTTVKAQHGNAIEKTTRTVISGVCALATRHDALPTNPCRETQRISSKPKNPPRSLSVQEIQQLRAYLSYDPIAVQKDLGDLVSFLIASGARIGEVCALSWADVDLTEGTAAIRGTVLRIKGKGLVISRAKTKAGERVLELPSWCVEMVGDRRILNTSRQPIRRTRPAHNTPASPENGRDWDYVFPTEMGHLRDPANTRRDLREAFRRAGYEGITSHILRKSVATLMDDAGLTARSAAVQLGPAQTTTMTQNIYFGRKVRKTGAAEVLEVLGKN